MKIDSKEDATPHTVSTDATINNLPEGFVEIPGVSIKGTETWTPKSNLFVSGYALEISKFYMCDHPVTQDEFKNVMGINPSVADASGEAGKNPVNTVNWYDAITYCNKLSIKEGLIPCYKVSGIKDWNNLEYSLIPNASRKKWDSATCDFTANGYRLPTSAEWEWAARGGENYLYAGSDTINEVAWYEGNSDNKTHEVKQKKPNGYGLFDMCGNISEWCWDLESFSELAAMIRKPAREVRGAWYTEWTELFLRISRRNWFDAYGRDNYAGFRLVRSVR